MIDWNITSSEWDNLKINGYLTGTIEEANEIAKRMQYISHHEHNFGLSTDDILAYFNSYQKSRMDFLADIATTTPTMESSKLFYGELIAGIDKNRILLDRISGIEGFRYQIELHDCRNCEKSSDYSTHVNNQISLKNDFAISIPNDIIGQHAFYTIIENVIRNTAKHSTKNDDAFVTFHINVYEPSDAVCRDYPELKSCYEIHIYDDFNTAKEEEDFSNDDKIFFRENGLGKIGDILVEDIVKIDRLEKLVYRQNIFINQPLLDRENKLRQGAWGMIEMEAAAAYLRKIPVESIDEPQFTLDIDDLKGEKYGICEVQDCKSANILKAFIKETNLGQRHLAYRFFLLKPKDILAILDDNAIARSINTNVDGINFKVLSTLLSGYGIWLRYKGDNPIDGLSNFGDNTIYEHEILLNMTNDILIKNPGVWPDRIVNMDLVSQLVQIKHADDARKVKDKVWNEFSKKISGIFIHNYKHNNQWLCFKEPIKREIMAIFSTHGDSWNSDLFPCFPEQYQYLEITTGFNNLTDTLEKSSSSETNDARDEAVYTKLLCAINAQIIVLDERIQEAAFSLKYPPQATEMCTNPDPIPFHDLYISSGIYVPNPENEFNFSRISYVSKDGEKTAKEKIKCLLGNIGSISLSNGMTENLNRVQFLVMHLGVLEKILNDENTGKSSPAREREEIEKLVFELKNALPIPFNEKVKPVIISGRGLPSNLPFSIPYLSYSAFSQYLIDKRNKYLMTELLFAARKIPQK